MRRGLVMALGLVGCSSSQPGPVDVTHGDPPEATAVGRNRDAIYVLDEYERFGDDRHELAFTVVPRDAAPSDVVATMACGDVVRGIAPMVSHDASVGRVRVVLEEDDCAPDTIELVIETSKGCEPIRMTLPRVLLYRARVFGQ